MKVLALDESGFPRDWISPERVAYYECKNLISNVIGDSVKLLHGGTNRLLSSTTVIEVPPIVFVKGISGDVKKFRNVALTNDTLFARDRCTCAYCGNIFKTKELSREHIHPTSKGGLNIWENVVTACFKCNGLKSNKTLKEAGMELLYVPYVPNHYEHLILKNRNIQADQMDYLVTGIPRHSRILLAA